MEEQGLMTGLESNRVYSSEDSAYFEACQRCLGVGCGFYNTWICPCCCPSAYKTVEEGNVAIVQEFGRFSKLYLPGLHFVNPCTENITYVDKRERVLDIRRQTVMTKDNINIIIDAVVYYQVENSYRSIFSVKDVTYCIAEISHTSLRDVFGGLTLQEALEEREIIAEQLIKLIAPAAANWGVNVRRLLLQEIIFTLDLQKTLSSSATARRVAEGKVISAQADVTAAKLLRSASEILNTPAAMQIRYLESVNFVSKTQNPKVVFFPSDFRQSGGEVLAKAQQTNRM